MVNEFENVVKDWLAQYNKHNWGMPMHIYNTDDFRYYALYSVENYVGIVSLFKKAGEFEEKVKAEEWEELRKLEYVINFFRSFWE